MRYLAAAHDARGPGFAFRDEDAVKSLLWMMFGAAGLGFAAWVYFVPYHKMQTQVGSRQSELAAERGTAESAKAERERLKTDLSRFMAAEREKSESQARRKAALESLASGLKTGVEELGGTVVADKGALQVSFPASKLIDKNGIDVSDGGLAALKIVAGSARRENASIRIHAKSSAAAPPKELRGLFHTAGEMNAVRAARVMSALENDGLSPGRLTIVGDPPAPGQKSPRGKKGAPAPADRVELEIQPE
jgi:hypothetical protein